MTTPKQRNERLLQVVRVLRELPKGKRFDLARWYKCGSVACAVGWSASDPWFTRRGFKLAKSGEPAAGFLTAHYDTHHPIFKGDDGFHAVAIFFGIDEGDTNLLFDKYSYRFGRRSRRDVIRRIEKFVRDNPA